MRYREDIDTRLTGRHKLGMKLSGNVKNKKILNIGCWIGWYERYAVTAGCQLMVGLDMGVKFLKKVRCTVPEANFVFSSGQCLPFKDNSFDLITMFDTLEHLPPQTEIDCFKEVNRVLDDTGRLVISTPTNAFLTKVTDPGWYLVGHRHYSTPQLNHFLEAAGFKAREVVYGGRLAEVITAIFMYIFKWIFRMEVPFKKFSDRLRDKEYDGSGGYVTVYVISEKAAPQVKT